MKKVYNGLKAEKVDFGNYDLATIGSLPPGCGQIVADVVKPGMSTCDNPPSTTNYMYYGNSPFANNPDPDPLCE